MTPFRTRGAGRCGATGRPANLRAMKNLITCALVLSAAPLLASALQAQNTPPALSFPAPSPAASVTQRVGLTDIEIKYSRPGMKGRAIFGGLVPYGEVWRTGANAATKVTFSTDVKFGGQAVPAGTYALATIPEQREWTVILNKNTELWGTYSYDQAQDVVRVKAPTTALPQPLESFTIGIDEVHGDSAQLTLAWDKTMVRVPITVDVVGQLVPKIEAAMAATEGKKPYFQAAMFYYENNLDLKLAKQWIEAAIAEQPEPATWMVYRKGLILKKSGDKAGALAAAQESLALAEKAGGELAVEYKRLNEELIASLK